MSLRIIGGAFKGRMLKTPAGDTTRPTQSILREAVFNICQHKIEEARFLDFFAGSGAVGLEALSRGAKFTVFVEQNRRALHAIKENIVFLQVEKKTKILPYSADAALQKLTEPFDIIYIDPPYDLSVNHLIELLLERNLLAPDGILFLEQRKKREEKPPLFSQLTFISSRRFGEALLYQYISK